MWYDVSLGNRAQWQEVPATLLWELSDSTESLDARLAGGACLTADAAGSAGEDHLTRFLPAAAGAAAGGARLLVRLMPVLLSVVRLPRLRCLLPLVVSAASGTESALCSTSSKNVHKFAVRVTCVWAVCERMCKPRDTVAIVSQQA